MNLRLSNMRRLFHFAILTLMFWACCQVTPEAKKKAAEAKSRADDAFRRKEYSMAVDAYTQVCTIFIVCVYIFFNKMLETWRTQSSNLYTLEIRVSLTSSIHWCILRMQIKQILSSSIVFFMELNIFSLCRNLMHMLASKQAIDFDPSDATLFSNRSLCWIRLGQADQALTDAQSCRGLRPNWVKAWYREGSALRLMQACSSFNFNNLNSVCLTWEFKVKSFGPLVHCRGLKKQQMHFMRELNLNLKIWRLYMLLGNVLNLHIQLCLHCYWHDIKITIKVILLLKYTDLSINLIDTYQFLNFYRVV